MADLAPDTVIGQYHIISKVAAGGMATVYRAHHTGLDRIVALKVLPPHYAADTEFLERFRLEARIVARLRHPNILEVYDFGERDDGLIYIVNEFMEGGTLSSRLAVPMRPDEGVELIEQIAAGLDYAHDRGVLHRDIKPSNILFNSDDEAVIGDFGLSKMLEGKSNLTQSGVVVGTPEFMAPEQAMGEPLDRRADVYSLGVIMYRMLVGSLPFSADSPMATALAQVNRPLPPPRSLNPNLPVEVEQVLFKALTKEPAERYSTAGALAAAYRGAVLGSAAMPKSGFITAATAYAPAPPGPVSEYPSPRTFASAGSLGKAIVGPTKYRWGLGAAAVGVVALASIVIGLNVGRPPSPGPANAVAPAVAAPAIEPTQAPANILSVAPVPSEAEAAEVPVVDDAPPPAVAGVASVEEEEPVAAEPEPAPVEAPAPPPQAAPRPTPRPQVAQPPPAREPEVREASVPQAPPAPVVPAAPPVVRAAPPGELIVPMGEETGSASAPPPAVQSAPAPVQRAVDPGVIVAPMGAPAPTPAR